MNCSPNYKPNKEESRQLIHCIGFCGTKIEKVKECKKVCLIDIINGGKRYSETGVLEISNSNQDSSDSTTIRSYSNSNSSQNIPNVRTPELIGSNNTNQKMEPYQLKRDPIKILLNLTGTISLI